MEQHKCRAPGCERGGRRRRGLCDVHYYRLRVRGTIVPRPRRTWRNVLITDGCWLWTGPVNNSGYGSSSGQPAHRVVYIAMGGEIPPGLHLDHLCRNRLCVRLDHLEPVTPSENKRRSWAAIKATA